MICHARSRHYRMGSYPMETLRPPTTMILAALTLLVWRPGTIEAQPPASGDRLFVGVMTDATIAAMRALPPPEFPNQKFCTLVPMVSGQLREAYVPTAAERTGNFSPFDGVLYDPDPPVIIFGDRPAKTFTPSLTFDGPPPTFPGG